MIYLVENHVDVAIRIGRLPDSNLVAQRLGETYWLICVSPNYLQRRGIPVTAEYLERHDCIAFEGLQRYRMWSFGRRKAERQIAIQARFAGNTADAVIEAAVAYLGIARLLSYQAADFLLTGLLVRILSNHNSEPREVHLVHIGPQFLPLKLRAFLDFVAPKLRARLKEGADV